jgi:hypothetical protein
MEPAPDPAETRETSLAPDAGHLSETERGIRAAVLGAALGLVLRLLARR